MKRKYEQNVTTDERRAFTKVLGAVKDKGHHDQTLGNTRGNNNKDAMFDWRSGYQSEDKRNCHIYVTSFMIITFIMFLHKQRTLSAVIFLFVQLAL